MGQLQGKNDIWNYILSGFRMFVFTPFMLIMAIIGIFVCIIQDLLLFIFKQVWTLVKHKSL